MIVFPQEFVKTKHPGYYWNTVEHRLYTIKVTGELRPMAFNKGGHFYGVYREPGYQISVKGRKRKLTMDYLGSLKATDKQEVVDISGC